MNDERLAELALEYADIDQEVKQLEADKGKLKKRLLKEMERRGTEGIVTHGVKITYVKQTTTGYIEDKLRRKLGQKLWQRVTERKLSKDKLMAAVHEGQVDLAKVESCSFETEKAPYPVVTPVKE